MEATTMDTFAQTSVPMTETPPVADVSPATEALKPETEGALRPVVDVLEGAFKVIRWIWRFDIGAVALISEQTARLIKAIEEKGKEVEPTVAKPFKKVESGVGDALEEVGTRLKEIAKPAPSVDAPVLAEVRELSSRVEELTQRIETLQAKQDTKVTAAAAE